MVRKYQVLYLARVRTENVAGAVAAHRPGSHQETTNNEGGIVGGKGRQSNSNDFNGQQDQQRQLPTKPRNQYGKYNGYTKQL